jgi:hypothetical protein
MNRERAACWTDLGEGVSWGEPPAPFAFDGGFCCASFIKPETAAVIDRLHDCSGCTRRDRALAIAAGTLVPWTRA